MVGEFHLSERRACRLVGLSRDSYRHPPVPDEATVALSAAIIDLGRAQIEGLMEGGVLPISMIRWFGSSALREMRCFRTPDAALPKGSASKAWRFQVS